jgi:hypothetical protein
MARRVPLLIAVDVAGIPRAIDGVERSRGCGRRVRRRSPGLPARRGLIQGEDAGGARFTGRFPGDGGLAYTA